MLAEPTSVITRQLIVFTKFNAANKRTARAFGIRDLRPHQELSEELFPAAIVRLLSVGFMRMPLLSLEHRKMRVAGTTKTDDSQATASIDSVRARTGWNPNRCLCP